MARFARIASAGIRAVHTAAFGGPAPGCAEADIVDRLRAAGALTLSLVAVDEQTADEDGRVVGHIAFSPVTLDGRPIGVGLAPVGVLPSHQRRGIGDALCREGLARVRALGAGACVVLGHAAYPRFGFVHAPSTWGARWEGGHDDSFFAIELLRSAPHAEFVAGTLGPGVVRYRREIG